MGFRHLFVSSLFFFQGYTLGRPAGLKEGLLGGDKPAKLGASRVAAGRNPGIGKNWHRQTSKANGLQDLDMVKSPARHGQKGTGQNGQGTAKMASALEVRLLGLLAKCQSGAASGPPAHIGRPTLGAL